MKNILGKLIVIALLELICFADAKLATYSLSANKKEVYVKEAVEITFHANQKDHKNVMFFFLTPKQSNDYEIKLLHKTEGELTYHNKKTTFTYLLFPLKSGEIKVNFDFTIKVASDEAVAQVYSGGRNNVKWIDTIDTKITLQPLSIQVKKLESGTDLVGDFKIVSKLKKTHITSYESANITYFLEGKGYDESDINIIDNIDNINIFKDIKTHLRKATTDGYKIKKEYSYALIGEKDFFIKPKEIKCYSVKQNRYYTIQTTPYNIKVDKLDNLTLIDNENYPTPSYDFETIKTFFIYFSIFAIGFISAKLMPNNFKIARKKQKYDDIKEAKTPKELLLLLMDRYSKYDLKQSYNDLESLIYKNSAQKSFKTIKNEVLEALK